MSANSRSPLKTPEEAAEYLRGNTRTLERWRATGRGPKFIKMGRRVRYTDDDLDAWVAEQRREHTAAEGQATATTATPAGAR